MNDDATCARFQGLVTIISGDVLFTFNFFFL